MKKKIYACWFEGRESEAIFFDDWDTCAAYVKGVSGISYRGFSDQPSAEIFLFGNKNPKPVTPPSRKPDKPTKIADDALHIYVDGSYLPTHEHAGWAWVAITTDGIIAEESGLSPEPAVSRNIDGEVLATLAATHWVLDFIKNLNLNLKKICLHHDYLGVAKWAQGEWKTNTTLTQSYHTAMKKAIAALHVHKIKLEFVKVSAHSGERWNDYVDAAARKAIHQASKTRAIGSDD